jgi:hypothetical protein
MGPAPGGRRGDHPAAPRDELRPTHTGRPPSPDATQAVAPWNTPDSTWDRHVQGASGSGWRTGRDRYVDPDNPHRHAGDRPGPRDDEADRAVAGRARRCCRHPATAFLRAASRRRMVRRPPCRSTPLPSGPPPVRTVAEVGMYICEWCREELNDDDLIVDVLAIKRGRTSSGAPQDVAEPPELYHVRCWSATPRSAGRSGGGAGGTSEPPDRVRATEPVPRYPRTGSSGTSRGPAPRGTPADMPMSADRNARLRARP